MSKMNLYKEIKYIVENFSREAQTLLFLTEVLNGATNTEKCEDFLRKISLWQNQYFSKSEEITLYGYMTWNLEISIIEFYYSEVWNTKTYLLKILLINFFKDKSYLIFNEDMDIQSYFNINCFEILEYNRCYFISHDDFINDLEHYYDGSKARFLSWRKKYHSYLDMINKLMLVM